LKRLAIESPDRLQAAVEQRFAESKSDWLSYHEPLEYARQWSRAGRQETGLLRAAVRLLTLLREQYPHALEIDEELTFALLELGETVEAEQVIREVEQRYPSELLVEIRCRRGRKAKDQASARMREVGTIDELAREMLSESLRWYQLAYESKATHYPAVNVASVTYLLDGVGAVATNGAVERAEEALVAAGNPDGKDKMWLDASRAEVLFLQGKHEEAATFYKLAADHVDHTPHSRETMLRQLQLLLRVPNTAARSFWTAEKLVNVFGEETYAAVFGPVDASRNNEDRSI
jgi:hypothetical protein